MKRSAKRIPFEVLITQPPGPDETKPKTNQKQTPDPGESKTTPKDPKAT
jgi:hypothetical protein